ncbi:hypothetical protein [Vibrio owensii]|uniref:hypothetical protein n=1 Tax=Vibrio owensii TaxID=696485 RepID=UPI0018F1E4B3|nr:hypothetical protein [Vibrio owensii]
MRNQFKMRKSLKIICALFFTLIVIAACVGSQDPAIKAETACMNKWHSVLNKREKQLGVDYSKNYRYDFVNRKCNR